MPLLFIVLFSTVVMLWKSGFFNFGFVFLETISHFPPFLSHMQSPGLLLHQKTSASSFPEPLPRMQQGWGRPGIVTHKPCIKLRLISWQPCEGGAISILQISRVRLRKIKQYAPVHLGTERVDQGSNSELSGYKAYLPPTIVHANSSFPCALQPEPGYPWVWALGWPWMRCG